MKQLVRKWAVWVEGLIGAVIGGTANAVAAMIADPSVFNLDTGLPKLGKFMLVSGVFSASLYLRQRPLPPLEDSTEPSTP